MFDSEKRTKIKCSLASRGLNMQNYDSTTVFPHIRPAGIIILHSLQMRVLLENSTFLLHKIVRIAGIIRVAGIIRGWALYEEIR